MPLHAACRRRDNAALHRSNGSSGRQAPWIAALDGNKLANMVARRVDNVASTDSSSRQRVRNRNRSWWVEQRVLQMA